jgi:hypothetical protein
MEDSFFHWLEKKSIEIKKPIEATQFPGKTLIPLLSYKLPEATSTTIKIVFSYK